MSTSQATASPVVAAEDAEGYLLLTIQNTTIKQVFDNQEMDLGRGELRIECISLPIPPEVGHQSANPFAPSPSDPPVPTHDFWLVLKIEPSFEMPLIPLQKLEPVRQPVEGVQYRLPSSKGKHMSLLLTLPKPSSSADLEDLESFEVLLRQYKSMNEDATALEGVEVAPLGLGTSKGKGTNGGLADGSMMEPLPEEVRGKLILVNEDNGEIIGEMDQDLKMDEDKMIAGTDTNRPVILDFGGDIEGFNHVVHVKTVKEEDMDDWMLRGAHNISQGILSFGGWSSRMMTAGSEKFIRSSTPRAEPVKFSPATKTNIRRAHNVSAKSVHVTKKTVGKINDVIGKVIDHSFEKGIDPTIAAVQEMRRNSTSSATRTPPPVPPRKFSTPTSSRGSSVLNLPSRGKTMSEESLITFEEEENLLPAHSQTPEEQPRRSVAALASRFETPSRSTPTPPRPIKPAHLTSKPTSSSRMSTSAPGTLSSRIDTKSPPPLPPRSISPNKNGSSLIGRQVPIPENTDVLTQEMAPAPPYTTEPGTYSPSNPGSGTSTPKKRGLFSRIIQSAEVVMTSVEATTSELVTSGTAAAANAAHHKYGAEAGQATALLGGSVRNVVVMYVDVRGVGRKAIVKRTAKHVIKGRLANGEEVKLQPEGEKGEDGLLIEAGEVEKTKEGELVVGVPQVGGRLSEGKEKEPVTGYTVGKDAEKQGL